MHGEEHPIGVLCGTHVIQILMFLDGNGPSCKTEIYSAVGRSATMPQKIASLADAGLVVLRRKGISEVVELTELGSAVSAKLREIDGIMA